MAAGREYSNLLPCGWRRLTLFSATLHLAARSLPLAFSFSSENLLAEATSAFSTTLNSCCSQLS